MKQILLLALVLLATIVAGQEGSAPAHVPDPGPLVLTRSKSDAPALDLFAPPMPQTVAPIATQVVPLQPPAPQPPPLPFGYLGRMKKGGLTTVYIVRNQEMLIARAGDTLDGAYQVLGVTDTALRLMYLPLGIEQTLSLPPEP